MWEQAPFHVGSMQLAAQVLTTKNKEMVTSHITGYLLVKLLNVVLKKRFLQLCLEILLG